MRHAAEIEPGLGCAAGSEHHGTITELHVPFPFFLFAGLCSFIAKDLPGRLRPFSPSGRPRQRGKPI